MADAGSITYTVEVDTGDAEKNLDKVAKATAQTADKMRAASSMSGHWAVAIAKFAAQAINGAMEMRSEIAKATGATGEALDALASTGNRALQQLAQSQEEVGRALGELNTRFALTGEALEDATVRIGRFARITGQDMQGAVQSVARQMAAWGVSAEDLGKVLNRLTVAGQTSGKSVGELSASLSMGASVLKQFGLSMDEAMSFLMSIERSGLKAETVFAGLRIAMRRAGQEGRSARDVWEEMTAKISAASTAAEKNTIALSYMGESAGNLVDAISSGKLAFDEFTEALEGSDGALSDAALETQTFADLIARVKNIANSVFGDLSPRLGELLKAAEPLLQILSSLAQILSKGLADALNFMSPLLRGLAQGFEGLRKAIAPTAEEMREYRSELLRAGCVAAQLNLSKIANEFSEIEKSLESMSRGAYAAEGVKALAREWMELSAKAGLTAQEMTRLEEVEDSLYEAGLPLDQQARQLLLAMIRLGKEREQAIDDIRAYEAEENKAANEALKTTKAIADEAETVEDSTGAYERNMAAVSRIAKIREILASGTLLTAEETKHLKAETEQLTAALKVAGLTEEQIEQRLESLKGTAEDAAGSLNSKSWKDWADMILSVLQKATSAIGSLADQAFKNEYASFENLQREKTQALEAELEEQSRALDESLERQSRELESAYSSDRITQNMYERAKTRLAEEQARRRTEAEAEATAKRKALEDELLKKKNEIAKKEFDTQKGLAIANAVINAAQAIIQCFAQLGPVGGAIAAVAVGAATGVQIGLISNQEFVPSYDTGSGVLGSDRYARLHAGERVLDRQDTARLEALGGLSALSAPSLGSGSPIVIDNRLTATLDVDGTQMAIAVLRNLNEAQGYVY